MYKVILSIFISLNISLVYSQTRTDTLKVLEEVTIKAYLSEQSLISVPSSATVINAKQIERSTTNSLLPVLNTTSGVKMEERSPGSYRISIRGSLLRSPFGVRNIKVYYDDFPLTDAGGNTYFNLIDQSAIKNIEILKGPDGSLFGANSGGVILVKTQAKADEMSLNFGGGSYGYARQNFSLNKSTENFEYNINQAVQLSDGYRDHSQLKRYFFQTQEKWKYSEQSTLKFSGFYSDLGYETPGGLNPVQYEANPIGARPRVGNTPGAIEQQAGIYNKTLFGGLAHETLFRKNWKYVISLSGIRTDFENPFITNYEKRKENSFAMRTYFIYKNQTSNNFSYQWNTGWEYQTTNTAIRNFGNSQGTPTTIIAADRITNQLQFLFTRLALQSGEHLKAEISTSLSLAKFEYEGLPESRNNSVFGSQKLENQWMPRLALFYLFTNDIVARGIISRGYSIPTTAEIRASDAIINPDLKPESGWNYEIGFRARTPFERINVDVALFSYQLDNAIVRRVNANDQDFYVNAGGTSQKGIELTIATNLLNRSTGLVKSIDWNNALTFNDFKFKDYVVGANNFSGNLLTGVPKVNVNSNLNIDFCHNFNLFTQYQYNGKTSLNDAETVFAGEYHLVMSKLNWQTKIKKSVLNLSFGVDNLLNQKYSLGNDLNAFGNRFFNAAANRNYFVGLGVKF